MFSVFDLKLLDLFMLHLSMVTSRWEHCIIENTNSPKTSVFSFNGSFLILPITLKSLEYLDEHQHIFF